MAIASTAAVYLLVGILALVAARLAEAGKRSPIRRSDRISSRRRASTREHRLDQQSHPQPAIATTGSAGAISTPSSG